MGGRGVRTVVPFFSSSHCAYETGLCFLNSALVYVNNFFYQNHILKNYLMLFIFSYM